MNPKIGLSICSLVPYIFLPGGLRIAARMTKEAGYSFWQVLAFRGVSAEGLVTAGIPVLFVEPAWHPQTWRDYLFAKIHGKPAHIQDPLLFPEPYLSGKIFRQIILEIQATPIYNELWPMVNCLIEISPGLGRTPGQLADFALDHLLAPYVLDTAHLCEFPEAKIERASLSPAPRFLRARALEASIRQKTWWQEAIETLLSYIALVHVQAKDFQEWRGFIRGEPNQLAQMLWFLAEQHYKGPFVVEFDPRAIAPFGLLPGGLTRALTAIRERIEKILLLGENQDAP